MGGSDPRVAGSFVAAILVVLACGCARGGGAAEGRDAAGSAPQAGTAGPAGTAAGAPVDTGSALPIATRFAPARVEGVPDSMSSVCQPAAHAAPGARVAIDTTAMPRVRRSLGGMGEARSIIPLRCVVHDQAEWLTVRPLIVVSDTSGLRDVDFSREMLIVVTMGMSQPQNSEILVDGSWSRGDTLVVAVRDGRTDVPGTDSGDASPGTISRVPRVSGPVFFINH